MEPVEAPPEESATDGVNRFLRSMGLKEIDPSKTVQADVVPPRIQKPPRLTERTLDVSLSLVTIIIVAVLVQVVTAIVTSTFPVSVKFALGAGATLVTGAVSLWIMRWYGGHRVER